jgi:Ca2+-binding EF-hand superfamily protein
MSEEYKREYFAKSDLDKNGQLSFEEFMTSEQRTVTHGNSEEFKRQVDEFFSKLDHDHSGQLSSEEYNSVSHVKCM